jgi:hypothetical protein
MMQVKLAALLKTTFTARTAVLTMRPPSIYETA